MTTPQPQPRLKAGQVLRVRRVWVFPAVILSVVSVLLTVAYMGGILNPRGDMHHMPIGLVNADAGAELGGRQVNLGAQAVGQITQTPQNQISWQLLGHDKAMQELGDGHLYSVLEVPQNFSATVADLTEPTAPGTPVRPSMTIYTNPAAGSLASSLASSTAQATVQAVSTNLGKQLTAQIAPSKVPGATWLLLQDPVKPTVTVGHPLGSHSGLGLTAFYYTLLLVLAGFLGANIISNSVDVALGYAAADIGPLRQQAPLQWISRRNHFLVTAAMSAALSAVAATLVLVAAVYLVGMDASHVPLLWAYSVCAAATISVGVQALLATFGGLGQPIAMLIFIAYSLPSSGATIPLQTLPSFYRFLAQFEPMRQLTDGARAILYFDAQAGAGLTRAWIAIALSAVAATAFGLAVTSYYDHKGLHRAAPGAPRPGLESEAPTSA
ncbi:YhgE/Pip domain-containing protein [Streptacidiphilus rugosus]|uniref:YhgE/Pip domain-containing protein n=1 Tax=Streptacidiphilus rugosus TaxID=405783 RepID=UPI00055B5A70|nr:DUF3533 domain-containing protein [Streptacidiphilus rugosus]